MGKIVVQKEYTKGCPQGSCSGPLFWNIIADTALSITFEEDVHLQAFADDFLLLVKGRSRRDLENRVNTAVEKLHQWSQAYKLNFSVEKTYAMVFWKKVRRRGRETDQQNPREPKILLNNARINTVKETESPGNHHRQPPHMASIRSKAAALTGRLSRLVKGTQGRRGDILRVLYKHCVERMILYAVPVWWNNTVKQVEKLLTIQRYALIAITKAYRTASTPALLQVAGLEPIHLVAKRETEIFRLLKLGEPIQVEDEVMHRSQVQDNFNIWEIHPARRCALKWSARTPSNKQLEIFTDGSKMDGRVGAGVCVLRDGLKEASWNQRLSDVASVFDAELSAILQAIKWVKENEISETVRIYSDSQSALMAMGDMENVSPLVNASKLEIQSMNNGVTIFLHWVRGHSNIEGNEMADREAKDGSRKENIDIEIGMSRRVLKGRMHKATQSAWQEWWDSSQKGRHTYSLLPRVSGSLVSNSYHLTQVLTGHGNFPSYFRRFGIKDVRCRCGEVEADVLHYMGSCPMLRSPITSVERLKNLSCKVGRQLVEEVIVKLEDIGFAEN